MTRRKVMIRLLSKRSGLSMDGLPVLFDGNQNEDVDYDDEPEDDTNAHFEDLFSSAEDTPDETELLVEGRLVTTTHRVELLYEEDFSSDFGTTVTRIGFDRACPEFLTMLRSGAVETALVFEHKKRHLCLYHAPAAAFEVCVSTASVDNQLLTNGTISLDYYMEIHGVQTDHCKLTITVRDSE